METPLLNYFLRILNKLSYKYNFFASVKNLLRSVKYFIFGKSDITQVISEIKKARNIDNPVKVIFDIGAAVGDKTIIFLKSFPGATVYSFEPQTESLEKLKERTVAYKDRIKTFDSGFFNKNDTVVLNINPYRKDSSSILPLQKWMNQNIRENEKMTIQVIKIDDFIKKQKIEHIDFIKIDVEGVEKEVLEGGKETFQDKIDNVFIEISPFLKGLNSKDFSDIFHFFYETGFTFLGCSGDYFFSKDKDLLKKYF